MMMICPFKKPRPASLEAANRAGSVITARGRAVRYEGSAQVFGGGHAGADSLAARAMRLACPNAAQSTGETLPPVAAASLSCISGLGVLSPRTQ